MSTYDPIYYEQNREKKLASQKKYQQANKDKVNAKQRRYYARHRDEINRKRREKYKRIAIIHDVDEAAYGDVATPKNRGKK